MVTAVRHSPGIHQWIAQKLGTPQRCSWNSDEYSGQIMTSKLWKMISMSALLYLFPVVSVAQHERQERKLVIHEQPGEADVVEVGGRAYVDIEQLTQITHGSLSFKANRIVLNLPSPNVSPSATEPAAHPSHSPPDDSALSREFTRAGIEEIATMREWASTLAYAIQNGYQVTESWAANYREQSAHDLSVASTAVSTEADRHALQLLTTEFEAIRDWADKLIQERKSMNTAKYALSADALQNDPMSQKIITCGRFLAAMLGSGSFQDDPSCH
jgi:hypothetical protein